MVGTVAILLFVLVGGILFLRGRRHLPEGQRMVRIRFGRAMETLGPGGTALALPFIDQLQPVPEGRASFRGKAKAVLVTGLEIEPTFEGEFSITDAVAACNGLPVFSLNRIPSLQELEPYVVGSLAAQLKVLAESSEGQALVANTGRLATKWQHYANQQLQPTGMAIEALSIPDLGLPAHLAAEWALRAYQQQGTADSYPEPSL